MKGDLKREKSGRGRKPVQSKNKRQRSKNSTSTKDKRCKLRNASSDEDTVDLKKARGTLLNFSLLKQSVSPLYSYEGCEQKEINCEFKENPEEQVQ